MSEPATISSNTNGSINVSIYGIICAIYLWIDYLNKRMNPDNAAAADASKSSKSTVFAFIFLLIIWLTQFFITFYSLKQQCITPNYGLAAW